MQFEEDLMALMKKRHDINPIDEGAIYLRNVADNLKRNQEFGSLLQNVV